MFFNMRISISLRNNLESSHWTYYGEPCRHMCSPPPNFLVLVKNMTSSPLIYAGLKICIFEINNLKLYCLYLCLVVYPTLF